MNISKEDLMHKAKRESAPKLHKLYNNSAPFKIPTAKELMMQFIQLDKSLFNELKEVYQDDGIISDETLEYCKLLDVNYEDVEPLHVDSPK